MIGADYAQVDGNKIDPTAAVKAGIAFVFMRAAWGTLIDPVRKDIDRWREAGAVVGLYAYCRVPKVGGPPVPRPEVQMRAAIDAVGELDHRDMPFILDVEEENPALSPRDLHNWYHDAWKALADRYGTAPIEYTSQRYQHEVLHDIPPGEMSESPLWLARYPFKERTQGHLDLSWIADPPVPAAWGDSDDCWIHQAQGDAIGVPGFSNTVDLNRFRYLTTGSRGDRVRWVQRRLGAHEDGVYGNQTSQAVVLFQSAQGLDPDNKIGPATFARLCWAGAERPITG